MTYRDSADDAHPPRITPVVKWLIAINVAVYFVQLTVLRAQDVQLALGFQSHSLPARWWTIGTYMFVHGGFWHLALNLYVLWIFGPRVEWRWGQKEFLRYYLCAGLGGWFAHLAFVPGNTLLIGASAAILGVMLAYATFWPNEQVLVFGVIPTTVRWLVTAIAVINIALGMMTAAAGSDGIAHLAHLGGLAAGWVYLRTMAAVDFGRLRQGVSPVPDEPDDVPPRAVPKALPRSKGRERESIDDVVARSNAMVAKRNTTRRTDQERPSEPTALDRVLDKISAEGLGSLTRDERKLLDETSRKLRDE